MESSGVAQSFLNGPNHVLRLDHDHALRNSQARIELHRPIPVGGAPVESVAYGWKDLRAVIDREARSGAGGSSPRPG